MSGADVAARRAALIEALRSAHGARKGIAAGVEALVRAYARAMREEGADISRTLIDVKDLLRAHTGHDEPVFTPKVIGWTVAGYFHGANPRD